jgi:hypothetical protein
MRQETIIKTYLKFNELNDEQKEKVIENNRDINTDYEWWQFTKEDFHAQLDILGFYDVESYFSGFWSQGDGASFTGKFSYPENEKEIETILKNLIDNYNYKDDKLDYAKNILRNAMIEKKKDIDDDYYPCELEIYSRSNYCHSNTMQLLNNDNDCFLENCRWLADEYYKTLDDEYYYLVSDEAITETLIINDYEFDIDTLKIG